MTAKEKNTLTKLLKSLKLYPHSTYGQIIIQISNDEVVHIKVTNDIKPE